MGVKEEGAPIEVVLGFSGQLRPLQACVGRCQKCGEDVFAEAQKTNGHVRRLQFLHYACGGA